MSYLISTLPMEVEVVAIKGVVMWVTGARAYFNSWERNVCTHSYFDLWCIYIKKPNVFGFLRRVSFYIY